MVIFQFRDQLIGDYERYVTSFIQIRDARISECVQQSLGRGLLWPEPLIQLNPALESGDSIDDLVDQGLLHKECGKIFRKDKEKQNLKALGQPLQLHRYQSKAIPTICICTDASSYLR